MINFGSRYFVRTITRWYSPDPFADSYTSWNPYNYALNNPLLYTDPSGNYVRPFERERQGGGSDYDFDDNTDLYGNPIMPPGEYIDGVSFP